MQKKGKKHGLGLIGALTLIFIAAGVFDVIDWPWLWMFCPVWVSALFFFGAFLLILIGGRVKKGRWRAKRLYRRLARCRTGMADRYLRGME